MVQNVDPLQMRVGEAKNRDVGKKRARIGPDAMDYLHASPGDTIIFGSSGIFLSGSRKNQVTKINRPPKSPAAQNQDNAKNPQVKITRGIINI